MQSKEELYEILSKPIPKEFLFSYTVGDKQLTGYNAQYAIDLLNSTLGLSGWVCDEEILQQGKDNGKWLVVMKLKLSGEHIDASGYGGSYSTNAEDAYKGAKSNAIKNACRYLGIGRELYYTDSTSVANTLIDRINSADSKELKGMSTEVKESKDKAAIEAYNKRLIATK